MLASSPLPEYPPHWGAFHTTVMGYAMPASMKTHVTELLNAKPRWENWTFSSNVLNSVGRWFYTKEGWSGTYNSSNLCTVQQKLLNSSFTRFQPYHASVKGPGSKFCRHSTLHPPDSTTNWHVTCYNETAAKNLPPKSTALLGKMVGKKFSWYFVPYPSQICRTTGRGCWCNWDSFKLAVP